MSQQTKILMVCLGNICRSPLAEVILRSKVNSEKVFVDSAGTANYHVGESPDPRSISTGKKHGLDLTKLRGRQFEVSDFDIYDYIYVMDHSNYKNVIALARHKADKKKVGLILEKTYPGKQLDVPDPWFGNGEERFPEVYHLLEKACAQIAKEL